MRIAIDWEDCTTEASRHNSTATAAWIATETSWMKLWDMALNYGPYGTDSLQALYRELTRPLFQPGICHICDAALDVSYFFIITHSLTRLGLTQSGSSPPFSVLLTIFLCMPNISSNFITIRSYSFSFFMPCHCIWLKCKYGICYLLFARACARHRLRRGFCTLVLSYLYSSDLVIQNKSSRTPLFARTCSDLVVENKSHPASNNPLYLRNNIIILYM